MEQRYISWTYYACFFLLFGIFVSVSLLPVYQILIAIPCLYFFKLSENRIFSKSIFFLMALSVITIASNIYNIQELEIPVKSFTKVKFHLLGILAFFPLKVMAEKYLSQKRARMLLTTFWLSIIAACIYGIVQLKFNFDLLTMSPLTKVIKRSRGFTGVMRYGYGLGMVGALMTGLLLNYARVKNLVGRNLFILGYLAVLVGIWATQCRGALLGLLCSLPFSLYYYKKKLGIIATLVVFVGVVVLAAVSLSGGSKKSRFLMKVNSRSNQIRLIQYQAAYYAWKEKPLLGHGNLQFSYHVPRLKDKHDLGYKDYSGHAHNIFFEAAANTGILGFLALVGFLGCWFYEMLKGGFWQKQLVVPFLISLLISSQFENIFDANNSSLIFFLYPLSYIKFPRHLVES